MARVPRVGSLVALLLAGACALAVAQPVERVARVVDGDTLVLATGEVIRVENIDTPELQCRCRNECELALQAREFTAAHIGAGIGLLRRGQDRHRRTLARVILPSGADLGAELIARGLARPWAGRRQSWCP